MVHEISHTQNAQEQANQFIQHINMAQNASNPDSMREHLKEAFRFGENALINMEAMLDAVNDLTIADNIEEAMDHIGRAIEDIESVDQISDDDLGDTMNEISQQAEMSFGYLTDAIGKMA